MLLVTTGTMYWTHNRLSEAFFCVKLRGVGEGLSLSQLRFCVGNTKSNNSASGVANGQSFQVLQAHIEELHGQLVETNAQNRVFETRRACTDSSLPASKFVVCGDWLTW